MKRFCQWSYIRGFSMASVIGLALIGGNAGAQTGSAGNTISVNGTISSITGSDMSLMANSGPVVVKLGDNTIIRGEVPVRFSDVTSGMYVGATAEKQPDGTFRASRLHIFPRTSAAPERATGR